MCFGGNKILFFDEIRPYFKKFQKFDILHWPNTAGKIDPNHRSQISTSPRDTSTLPTMPRSTFICAEKAHREIFPARKIQNVFQNSLNFFTKEMHYKKRAWLALLRKKNSQMRNFGREN